MTTTEADILLRLSKNEEEEIRITAREYKGVQYVDIRLFFKLLADANAEWRPTKKGLTMTAELFDELMRRLNRVRRSNYI